MRRIIILIITSINCIFCSSQTKINKSKEIDITVKIGEIYSFKIDPIDAYFNDDDFERFGFKVDNVDVKSLTEGTVYTSDNLCGLYLIK